LSLIKVKVGIYSVHQFADWKKLAAVGWNKVAVPKIFKTMSDDEIWWPRNTKAVMNKAASGAGWRVLQEDLNLVNEIPSC
jgi:hypothetical protein